MGLGALRCLLERKEEVAVQQLLRKQLLLDSSYLEEFSQEIMQDDRTKELIQGCFLVLRTSSSQDCIQDQLSIDLCNSKLFCRVMSYIHDNNCEPKVLEYSKLLSEELQQLKATEVTKARNDARAIPPKFILKFLFLAALQVMETSLNLFEKGSFAMLASLDLIPVAFRLLGESKGTKAGSECFTFLVTKQFALICFPSLGEHRTLSLSNCGKALTDLETIVDSAIVRICQAPWPPEHVARILAAMRELPM
jgi:hypothetical protein